MKRLIVATILSAILAVSSFTVEAKAIVNPNANSHVVFYIPHQDDEVLTFGVSIMNHIRAGNNVHIVLLTDGSESVIRKRLNMTEKDFSEARNREFNLSTSIMGVEPQNIDFINIKDGTFTKEKAEEVIRGYETKYPNAKHKTFSWTDSNAEHKVTGMALKKLQTTNVVSDARYYVRMGENPKGIKLISEKYSDSYKPFLLAASSAYNIENSRTGFYAIGYKSVPKSFKSFEKKPMSRYHK